MIKDNKNKIIINKFIKIIYYKNKTINNQLLCLRRIKQIIIMQLIQTIIIIIIYNYQMNNMRIALQIIKINQ
jgi:hypothetical protein